VPYGSEAGMFQSAGMSTIICGPGDILQAHTADEWIAVSEIEACMAYFDRLAGYAGVH
jgi:acetylornithine deacetylase